MVPLDDYITDAESARICGVSVNTLNRFIETGYLKVEHDHDGLRLFSKNQLKRVFGVSDSAFIKVHPIGAMPTFSGNAVPKVEVAAAPTPPPITPEPKVAESPKPHLRVVDRDEEPAKVQPPPQVVPQATAVPTPEPTPQPAVQAKEVHVEQPVYSQPNYSAEKMFLEAENNKLKNVVTLLEKMLDIRESEIESLNRQSRWLEERIERMEERSNREQILLLAESETVRKLVVLQHRSPIRAALEWLGLAEQTDYRGTIDGEKK